MTAPSRRLPLLLAAAALALAWNIGGWRLLDPDEGRNAEVAREMAQSGDFVLPHLDGLPYLDKPVLYFAAAAAAMRLLGPTAVAARLPAYLAALATIALLVVFARRRWGADAGWLAGLAFATMPMTFGFARETIFDMLLTLCITAAIVWLVDGRVVLAWAAIGLGAITKGPVALLVPLLAVIPWALATGRPLRRLVSPGGVLAFVVCAVPWFVAVMRRQPDFAHYAFVRETFERVTTRSFHRAAPLWYYLPILPVAAFPWIVPALARLGRWREAWRARRDDPAAGDAILLASWVVVPLVFFSINQSKLPHYMLPLLPALALAAARVVAADGVRPGVRVYAAVGTALALALVTLTIWLPNPISLTPAEKGAIPGTALALGVACACSVVLVAIAAYRGGTSLGALGYAAVGLVLPFVSGRLMRAVGDDRSSAPVVEAAAATLGPDGAAVAVEAYPPSLPFYLRRPVTVATTTAREMTSNYIADHLADFRALPGSPLVAADAWPALLAACRVPTVFLTQAGNRPVRDRLARALPLLAEDDHYAVYGPCLPKAAG